MTYNEAIDCLMADKEYLTDHRICDGEEMDVALNAINESMKYRKLGTPEEIEKKLTRLELDEAIMSLPSDCIVCKEKEELERYKELGTFEELEK